MIGRIAAPPGGFASQYTSTMRRLFPAFALVALGAATLLPSSQGSATAPKQAEVSVLAYHRFGRTVNDGMTVRTATFRSQLDYLKEHHHPVIPLRTLISYLQGHSPAPPAGAVVITVDDGHQSVVTEMLPLVREYNVPVTLFIYPSAISNASYAMTWRQLDALRETGLIDIQSHTYWHPNFRTEKRRLSATAYQTFATMQLVKPITVIERKLAVRPDLIAWPFGLYDDELIGLASKAGYVAGFTLDHRRVTPREHLMALPRFLVTGSPTPRTFAAMLPGGSR